MRRSLCPRFMDTKSVRTFHQVDVEAEHLDVSPQRRRGTSAVHSRAFPVALLTTTGRKSGEPRVSPLYFHRDGDHGAWWPRPGAAATGTRCGTCNLKANPKVQVQIKKEVLDLDRPRRQRRRASEVLAAVGRDVPDLRGLPVLTDRTIPLVVCEP